MDVEDGTAEEHRHRSARERQRRGPMWGCLRWLIGGVCLLLLLLFLLLRGGRVHPRPSHFGKLVSLPNYTARLAPPRRDTTRGTLAIATPLHYPKALIY